MHEQSDAKDRQGGSGGGEWLSGFVFRVSCFVFCVPVFILRFSGFRFPSNLLGWRLDILKSSKPQKIKPTPQTPHPSQKHSHSGEVLNSNPNPQVRRPAMSVVFVFWCRVSGFGFRVSGFGLWVSGVRFQVSRLGSPEEESANDWQGGGGGG